MPGTEVRRMLRTTEFLSPEEAWVCVGVSESSLNLSPWCGRRRTAPGEPDQHGQPQELPGWEGVEVLHEGGASQWPPVRGRVAGWLAAAGWGPPHHGLRGRVQQAEPLSLGGN